MLDLKEFKYNIDQSVRQKEPFLFAINYEQSEFIFIPSPENCSDIMWRVGKHSNFTPIENQDLELSPNFITFDEYSKKFHRVYSGIYQGDSFLSNLTIRTPLERTPPLLDIAHSATSKYLLYVPDRFVCFSPEPFIEISQDGIISSYPMKGTISVDVPRAEEVLLGDAKERAEHNTIVDLIRSDLSRVATNVEVESFGYIERLETQRGAILQMSSKIRGELLKECRDSYADTLFALLPAGSISGAPKPSTIKLISLAEGEDRGFYCGIFGYFDGATLDSSVMIRYIEQRGELFYYRSGGGITINSEVTSEYQEIKTKVYITR